MMLRKMNAVAVGFIVCVLLPFAVCWFERYDDRSCPGDQNEPWSYGGRNGPPYWSETFPMCDGRNQSPIDINTRSTVRDANLGRLQFRNYNTPISRARIENNGHTVNIFPEDGLDRTIVVENEIYSLTQFHFHWGDSSNKGSEHKVNGKQYSMELHLVHSSQRNQTAVVGVFYQETWRKNPYLEPIVNALKEVPYKDTRSNITSKINLSALVPNNPFYRYQGSLTTPPCTEGVTWSVFMKEKTIGSSQIAEFRKLYSTGRMDASPNCRLVNNFRPIQPLNNRTVYISKY